MLIDSIYDFGFSSSVMLKKHTLVYFNFQGLVVDLKIVNNICNQSSSESTLQWRSVSC